MASTLSAKPREAGESFLCLFDWDDNIVFGDTYILVTNHLGLSSEYASHLNADGSNYHEALEKTIGHLPQEAIRAAVGPAMVIAQPIIDMFRRLSSLPHVEMAVISDGMSWIIEECFVQVFNLPIPKIYTNPMVDLRETPEGPQVSSNTGQTQYSRLTWAMPDGHGCERCNAKYPNMCKSILVQDAIDTTQLRDPTIIYVGDGFNDSCPMHRVLRLRDHMCVRTGFGLERALLDLKDNFKGCCHHHLWHQGAELAEILNRLVEAPHSRLPPIALFGHEGGARSEFRTESLHTRIPGCIQRLVKEVMALGDGRDYTELLSIIAGLENDLINGDDVLRDPHNIVNDARFLPIPKFLSAYGSSWYDLPWLQGEIYFNQLLWHIFHTFVGPTGSSFVPTTTLPSYRVDGYLSAAVPNTSGYDMYLGEKTSVTETFFESHIKPMVLQVDGFLAEWAAGTLTGNQLAVRSEIRRLLSACVWGNTVDLSMFNKAQLVDMGKDSSSPHAGHAADHSVLDTKVVANDMDDASLYLLTRLAHYSTNGDGPRAVDIIMDNMGVECCADMLLGLVLCTVGAAGKLRIRYHTKPTPYYVSDVTPADIERMLVRWEADCATVSAAARFRAALASGAIEVHTHPYWVHPSEYRDMPSSVVNEYFFKKSFDKEDGVLKIATLPLSDLAIFKGDLNFRRVCGDRHWTPEMFFHRSRPEGYQFNDFAVPLPTVLRDYWPSAAVPMLCLRTNKSEIAVGPTRDAMQSLDDATNKNWRWNGQYGVALLSK